MFVEMLLFTIILLLIALIIGFLGFIYIRVYFDPLRKIPGHRLTRPIFGNFLTFASPNCSLFKVMKEDAVKLGPIRTWNAFFGKVSVGVGSQEWIKYVLNSKNFQRGDCPGAENFVLAAGENGLIVVDGEVHKKLRKLASPAFKHSSLKKIMPTVEMCGQRMVNLFKLRCDESENEVAEITVKEILNKATLDVIGLMAFGHDFQEACSFKKGTFGCYIREWLDEGLVLQVMSALPFILQIKRFVIKLSRHIPNLLPDVRLFRLAFTTNKLHDLVETIVQSKFEEMDKSDQTDRNKTMLDFILEASSAGEINNAEIHDTLMTFLIAGHETSTTAITWTLYLLAQHPNYQEKCRCEVNEFFATHKAPLDWDTLKSLSFLNAVIHESLRLYPPIPLLHRVSINADEILGYYIPPNSSIVLMIAEVHRNAEHWENPEEFIPERFLEPHDTIPWDGFMPFGDGLHKCIGYQLALTEILYFVAILLKNFQFSVNKTTEFHCGFQISLEPIPPMKLFVKRLR